MITQEFLNRIKAEPDIPGVTLILIAEIERLQANQKSLIEVALATLEYFRIEDWYGPEERGFARYDVEKKLTMAIERARGEQQKPVEENNQ